MKEKSEDQIIRTEYSEVMQKSYIDYAMSVIISRALPFAHRLRCILRIDAGRAQEEELLHAMRISVAVH